MERIVKVVPAFDKRNKRHGISDAQMYMVLKGELGCVTLSISTGWFLKATTEWKELCISRDGTIRSWEGHANGVAYCSPTPLYEWQKEHGRENCDWLECTCYGDISYTMADEPFEILVSEGSEAVWGWLQKFYDATFKPVIP